MVERILSNQARDNAMAEKRCFVIMPFKAKTAADRDLQKMYKIATKPAVEAEKFICERSDERSDTGLVTEHILTLIYKANVVIADLTNNNPNVMYELGFAHAFAKPVIMLVQDAKKTPFDLQTYRFIKYSTDLGGDEALRKEIRSALQALSDVEKIKKMRTNPVHLFLPDVLEQSESVKLVQRNRKLEEENKRLDGMRDLAESIIENLGATQSLDQIQKELEDHAEDASVTIPLESAEGEQKLVFTKVPKSKRVKVNLPPRGRE